MARRLTTSDAMARIAEVTKLVGAERVDVEHLVKVAGLDPARDFRFENWSGVSFAGHNLRGFDFTGARLIGCDFTDARISAARFDQAELGRVLHRPNRDPHAPAEIPDGVVDLRKAADFKELVNASVLPPPYSWPRRRPLDTTHLPTGAIFADVPGLTPEMVVVPGGEFWMGSPDGSGGDQGEEVAEEGRTEREGPRRRVAVPRFAIGRFTVTFEEWDAAQKHPQWREWSGIRKREPRDQDWGRYRHPVINVSWEDATAYCKWLNRLLGLPEGTYRLPSEAEWEYACRAGTDTPFWWGNEISTAQANYVGNHTYGNGKQGELRNRTVPVDSFEANPWGLHQVHGNVWEWCADSLHDSYEGAPSDGSAWTGGDRSSRVVRGGSWKFMPVVLRAAGRFRFPPDSRFGDIGFRVARVLSSARTLLPL